MANILHIDNNETACRAMRGILSRAGHRLVAASNAIEGWKRLRELVKFDLIISEVRLGEGGSGIELLARIRGDAFLKGIPVVFYTATMEQALVRKSLELQVQNYLIKPFQDAKIHAEITRAVANPWRNILFEEEKGFCCQMGFGPATLKKMREKVIDEVDRLKDLVDFATQDARQHEISEQIDTVKGDAEASGIWAMVEFCERLISKIEINQWSEVRESRDALIFVKNLIFAHIHPDMLPEGFLSDDEKRENEETTERNRWQNADVLKNGPLIQKVGIESRLGTVTACPSIDSSCASFCMYADGQVANLANLADVVCRDPGLTVEVLCAVNRIPREDMYVVDDPRVAINLLGEIKLNGLARNLIPVPDRNIQAPPFSWPQYWMFLMGVAHIAKRASEAMELRLSDTMVFAAGLTHDIGKLIIAHLYPHALPVIIHHARECGIPLHNAENRYLSVTSRELAVRWIADSKLPQAYKSVITWVEEPAQAKADQELVALVSMARQLAVQDHIGICGDYPKDPFSSLAESPGWQILRERVFPSFQLSTFEQDIRTYSRSLRQELMGRLH